ncbi:MAG: hypothetical protein KJ804_11120 [Proteobacteria bacterium]|nr:hypothetical protein [Pseudomonadota bacterium]
MTVFVGVAEAETPFSVVHCLLRHDLYCGFRQFLKWSRANIEGFSGAAIKTTVAFIGSDL